MYRTPYLFNPSYQTLIFAIHVADIATAQSCIALMSQIELSKIDNDGETALIWAASRGLEKVCKWLIPKMSEQAINQINNNGDTALTWAAYKCLGKVCEMAYT